MSELLNTFDLQTILLVLVFTAIAIREGMELYHYFHQKIYGRYQREDNEKDTINDMQATLQTVLDQVKQISNKIDLLQESDRDSIKSWIVMLYHKYKEDDTQLDSMQMDLLERRYKHYKEEGGNSYIDELMEELRTIYKKKGESHVSV